MKSLILILTALHVLAHGVFGCCGHGWLASAAAEEHCVCQHADGHHAERAHDHHGHDAPLSASWTDEGAPSRSPHECVHASCHWLTGHAAASSLSMDAWMPLTRVAILPADPFSLRAAESSLSMAAASFAAPPLRLHLALGVMLV
jgi:hypothetical protein